MAHHTAKTSQRVTGKIWEPNTGCQFAPDFKRVRIGGRMVPVSDAEESGPFDRNLTERPSSATANLWDSPILPDADES